MRASGLRCRALTRRWKTTAICPAHPYIRSSIGLDYASAAPVRGVRQGNSAESLAVSIAVSANAEQSATFGTGEFY
jgi:hypothetical protein